MTSPSFLQRRVHPPVTPSNASSGESGKRPNTRSGPFTLVWMAALGGVSLLCACSGPQARPTSGRDAISVEHVPDEQLMPVALRRLTNREFRKVASAVLETELSPDLDAQLPPDVRQEDGYTRNVEQTVSGALAVKLEQLVPGLVERALTRRDAPLFPCAHASAKEACIDGWLEQKARTAFRRPVTKEQRERLRALYERGEHLEKGAGPGLVLATLLMSPLLWYVSELGSQEDAPVVALSPYEIADQIGFVVRGTPADEALLLAAESGALDDGAQRQAHARRLLGFSDTREHYREFVLSWLEVDRLHDTAKSETVFARYEDFKPHMLAETEHFADEVFVHEGASVKKLLNAGFVSVDPNMAVFYGLKEFGARVSGAPVGRLGVLHHASFLASHSHADTTSPVLRGDFVLRKVLCHRLPRPGELDLEIIMPRPSEELTRREQFSRHGADPRCAECHDQIDGLGFVFEEFDAAGRHRSHELGKPVRIDGKAVYQQQTHSFADSRQLVQWLAGRPETSECFARQLFRFVTGRVHPRAEAAFVNLRQQLPEANRDNVLEHLVAYVGSPHFVQRRQR
jgi:hypothetical protein